MSPCYKEGVHHSDFWRSAILRVRNRPPSTEGGLARCLLVSVLDRDCDFGRDPAQILYGVVSWLSLSFLKTT